MSSTKMDVFLMKYGTKIAIVLLILTTFYMTLPVLYEVSGLNSRIAEDTPPVFEGSVEDLGIKLRLVINNITFSTDGTGSDWATPALKPSSKISPGENIFSTGKFMLDISSSPNKRLVSESENIVFLRSKTMETNQTFSEATGFHIKNKAKLKTAADHKDAIGSSTEYNKTLAAQAAVQHTLPPDYHYLNETLVNLNDDYGIDDGYFDGTSHRFDDGRYNTFVVGYQNCREDMNEDLKAYFAAQNNKDVDDIVISEVDISKAYITYNVSAKFRTFIKDLVRYAENRPESQQKLTVLKNGYQPIQLNRAKPFDLTSQQGLFDDVLGGISEGLNSATTFVGDTFTDISDAVSDPVGTWENILNTGSDIVQTSADAVTSTVGGVIGSVLDNSGSAADLALNVTDWIGSGINNVIEEPMGTTTDALGEVVGDLGGFVSTLILPLFLVLVLILVVYIGYKQVEKRL